MAFFDVAQHAEHLYSSAMVPVVSREELTKIHVELSREGHIAGEWMWARALGGNAYELHNIPFYAYGLNYLDVVEAPSRRPDGKPSVIRVLKRSGHRTLRVQFARAVPRSHRLPLLQALARFGASFEGADGALFAVDVEPDGDYQAVTAQLDHWLVEGILRYETCEPRKPDSFGDHPYDDVLN
jgi:hypothetical protein